MQRKLKKLGESGELLESIAKSVENSYISESITINVVTPFFGGSAKAGEVNVNHPVRSSSIRGHLRFWWRATRGASYENVYDLRAVEAAIFGDTTTPSPVKIWVGEIREAIKTCEAKTRKTGRDGKVRFQFVDELPSYMAFPFNYDGNDSAPYKYGKPFQFKLHIQVPSRKANLLEEEIYPALWAWINFGGIGARTRRGCGSLYCPEFSPEANEDIFKWFSRMQKSYKLELPVDDHYREWPVLRKKMKISGKKSIIEAWHKSVAIYQKFRRKSNGFMGRSFWPEADCIRHLTGMSEKKHCDSIILKHKETKAFPRAQFGLPIQFRFANRAKETAGKRDPYTTILKPKNKERLASPIITKPLVISSELAYPAIIVLSQPMIEELELNWVEEEFKGGDIKYFQDKKSQNILENIEITKQHIYVRPEYKDESKNPMKTSDATKPSAVDAFLNSREVQEWKKGYKSSFY